LEFKLKLAPRGDDFSRDQDLVAEDARWGCPKRGQEDHHRVDKDKVRSPVSPRSICLDRRQ
jgi:hypothetical protein